MSELDEQTHREYFWRRDLFCRENINFSVAAFVTRFAIFCCKY